MGGSRTLQALLQVPKSFDYFCPLSMGWTATDIATIEQNHRDLLLDLAANRNIKLLWISMGHDDPLLARIPSTLALFDKYGIEYTYVEVPGAHQPHVWRDQLHRFAPLLFREHGPHHGGHDDHR
jgi:enterochelin esterase family protein